MPDCELITKCSFFMKYSKTHGAVCDGIIAEYCRGSRQTVCKRKHHLLTQGTSPPENMLPGGSLIRLDAGIFCQDPDGSEDGKGTTSSSAGEVRTTRYEQLAANERGESIEVRKL